MSAPGEWLEACVAHTETVALATDRTGQRYTWWPSVSRNDESEIAGYGVVSPPSMDPVCAMAGLDGDTGRGVMNHVAHNDPERALRWARAARAILAGHRGCLDLPAACKTIRALLSVYSDQDGYLPEWAGEEVSPPPR